MSDRNPPFANGRSDPAELSAGELAAWWDGRTGSRRTGSTVPFAEEPTVAVVDRLEVLARADELSAPRPGFLDHLERQIMQTPPVALPTPIANRPPQPVPVMTTARPPRRSRGLVDILTVAAVVALLLGGSWSVFNDRANAPTPDGQNGVANAPSPDGQNGVTGVSTPDPAGLEPLVREVTLNQPWAEPVSNSPLNGLVPIPVTDCTTPSRSADWFTTVADAVATPLPIENDVPSNGIPGAVSPAEMTEHPLASMEDRKSVEAFFHQLVACRNSVEPGDDPATYLATGSFWNLLSTDFLLETASKQGNNGSALQGFELLYAVTASLGLQVYPAEILDVRELADDPLGRRQLVVQSKWVSAYLAEQMTVLVLDDGFWRVGSSNVMRDTAGLADREVGVASLLNSRWSAGMDTGTAQLFAEMPLSITVTNTAYSNLTVSIGGQDVGNITYGETLYTTPFSVSPDTVQDAGGEFPIDVALVGLGTLLTEPYRLTVGHRSSEDQTQAATPASLSTPRSSDGVVVAEPIVTLDQPWAENLPDATINGVEPVGTSECVTPSREAGSVEAAVEERLALGDAAPTIEPEFLAGPRIDPSNYPAAGEADVEAMTAFFRQLSACRFETGERDETQLLPYTGAYWNLYAVEALYLDNALDAFEDLSAEELVRRQYSLESRFVPGWSYPTTIQDVRQVPPDSEGRPRLLVVTNGSGAYAGSQASLLVQEDGQWRFLIARLLAQEPSGPVTAQVADILVGGDAYGPRSGNFSSQLEADFPVAMTIANVGESPQQVSVAGQNLGVVEPDEAIIVQPFTVRPEAVAGANGRLTFTVESVDPAAAADDAMARLMTIAVYPSGSLPYAPEEAGRATPAPAMGTAATPAPVVTETAATPVSTQATEPSAVVAMAAEPDRVVEIEQPWAVSTRTDLVNGIAPVDVSQCTVEPRASGALLSLVENAGPRPAAEFPDYVLTSEMDALFDQYPEGTDADLEAALGFFYEWSACRFEVGSADLPVQDRYSAAFCALRSNDNLLMAVPEGDGRTAESLVRQVPFNSTLTVNGPYPDEVLDVRVYPSDDRGQPRLLVRHRNVSGTPHDQVSLLVLEDGTWRLAERPNLLISNPTPATPDAVPENIRSVMTLNLDIANPDGALLVDWALSDVPIAVTITNSGAVPSPVMLGDQDLGVIGPGETVRVVPFVIPASVIEEAGGAFLLTVKFTGADRAEQRLDWSV